MKLHVRVKPNSKIEEVAGDGGEFLVKVKEPPEKGKANRAVIRLLAGHFNVPQSSVKILGGLRSKNKLIEVRDI